MSSVPVPKSIQIPRDAYRYWPEGEEIVRGSGKKMVRFIFENQKISDFEKVKLDRLLSEIKNGKIEGLEVPKTWSQNHILRFCYGTGWKTRSSVKSLTSHLIWRRSSIPQGFRVLYPKVIELLHSGAFYIHGRDWKYRPLIVMNFTRLDFKRYSIDNYSELLCFLLEYVLEFMMLPGQIENWVVLTDLGKNGLGNLSISSLKQVLGMLQSNYKCRLATNYIVNPPKSIWVMWSCIKPFLDDVTIDKIKISNSSYSQEMMTHFHPSQVEEKYGGKSPNLEDFWPPECPSSAFCPQGKSIKLLDKDSYYNFNSKEPDEELPEEPKPKPRRLTIKLPSRVNSLDLSVQNSDVQVEDLVNDTFARSDVEDGEENLVDFEVVSPFTRDLERNPTFKEWGQRSSKMFHKTITMRANQEVKKSKKSKKDKKSKESKKDKKSKKSKKKKRHIEEESEKSSLESSVDFEKDSKASKLFEAPPELEEKEVEASTPLLLEDTGFSCQCRRVNCGVIQNSCMIS